MINIFTARKRSLRRLCFYTCLSFCPYRGGVISQHASQVSRPIPRWEVEGSGRGGLQAHTQGEVEGSGQGEGSPGPHPGGRLRGLAGGSPGPHQGGWYPSMHWGRPSAHSRQLLLRAVDILLECILV